MEITVTRTDLLNAYAAWRMAERDGKCAPADLSRSILELANDDVDALLKYLTNSSR